MGWPFFCYNTFAFDTEKHSRVCISPLETRAIVKEIFMHTFEVWAPLAESVSVQVDSACYPMQKRARGYWAAHIQQAQPGSRYGYILDGAESAIPDPRSPAQPDGVNGLSQVVDHAAFVWHDRAWQAPPLASAVVYELHVGTFTPEGTLDAAIGKLDYLKELGVTHVELLPLASFSGNHGWGYDGVALFAPQHSYGGPEAVKRFVDSAHGKGLAVLNDVVYNHFGPAGNYTGAYGPYLTESHKTPWGGAVNLEDIGSSEVRRFFCDNALMWLRDYHFDGLRLDAVHAYIDRSAVNFMEQLADEVKALGSELGKHFVLIAESDLSDPRVVRPKEAGGYGLQAQWSDDFHHALWSVLTGETIGYYADYGSLEQLAIGLQEVFVYQGQFSAYRNRHHGRPVHDLPGYRFLGYIQNHDQVGNRAIGDRLSHLVGPGKLKIAAALVLTAPFVPMLFQGEEFAASTPFQYFTDHEDQELGHAVSEGRTREFAGFGWSPADIPDPQDPSTFHHSKLKWDEVDQPEHAEIRSWYTQLIALRHSHRAFTGGNLAATKVRFQEAARWLALERGPYRVLCNFSDKPVHLPQVGLCDVVLNSDRASSVENGVAHLQPESVLIVRVPE